MPQRTEYAYELRTLLNSVIHVRNLAASLEAHLRGNDVKASISVEEVYHLLDTAVAELTTTLNCPMLLEKAPK